MKNLARLGAHAARAATSTIREQSMDSVQQGMVRGLFTGRKIEQKNSQEVKDRVLENTQDNALDMSKSIQNGKDISSRQAQEGGRKDIRHSKATAGNSSKFSDTQLSSLAHSAKESYETSKTNGTLGKLTLSQTLILATTKGNLPLKTQAALMRAVSSYNTSPASMKPLQERSGIVG